MLGEFGAPGYDDCNETIIEDAVHYMSDRVRHSAKK